MKTGILILLLFISGLSGVQADDNSAALEKLHNIPLLLQNGVINEAKLPSIEVTPKGAIINGLKTPIPFDQVVKALADLPREAWPYGRAILYIPYNSGKLPLEPLPLVKMEKKVLADLKAADIELFFASTH